MYTQHNTIISITSKPLYTESNINVFRIPTGGNILTDIEFIGGNSDGELIVGEYTICKLTRSTGYILPIKIPLNIIQYTPVYVKIDAEEIITYYQNNVDTWSDINGVHMYLDGSYGYININGKHWFIISNGMMTPYRSRYTPIIYEWYMVKL